MRARMGGGPGEPDATDEVELEISDVWTRAEHKLQASMVRDASQQGADIRSYTTQEQMASQSPNHNTVKKT